VELNDHDVGRLLVEDDGTFVGLITRSDLVTAFTILRTGDSTALYTTDSGPRPAVGDEARQG
jgi:CBS domain-containing protein